MKSVTWAGLQRPGDAAGHPLTGQVLRESEECLSFSSLCLPLSVSILLFLSSPDRQLSISPPGFLFLPPLPSIPASELREDHESELCLL